MEVKGTAYLFFEQSGAFKNAFKNLGINAMDYDIQNDYGETDCKIDLFAEIEVAYENKRTTIFDLIGKDDIVFAFFPCIYFCEANFMNFSMTAINYRGMTDYEKVQKIIKRSEQRELFFETLLKLVAICVKREIRLIVENPYTMPHFFQSGFLKKPDLIDTNRTLRGDYYAKPTAYYFFNCKPEQGFTYQECKDIKKIRKSRQGKKAGICSKERSEISPVYANNFICDNILGITQHNTQLTFVF